MDQQASEQFRICFGVLSGLRFGFRVWEPMGLAKISYIKQRERQKCCLLIVPFFALVWYFSLYISSTMTDMLLRHMD